MERRGGKRAGSGRKVGSLTKKNRAIAEALTDMGLTPLEVMIKAMRQHVAAEEWDLAASIAKDAAPYMHPRLAQIDARHSGTLTLEALIQSSLAPVIEQK